MSEFKINPNKYAPIIFSMKMTGIENHVTKSMLEMFQDLELCTNYIEQLQNQLKEAEALISLIASPVEFYCKVGERSKQEAALSYQAKYMNKSGENEN